jgi:hypothetical protein
VLSQSTVWSHVGTAMGSMYSVSPLGNSCMQHSRTSCHTSTTLPPKLCQGSIWPKCLLEAEGQRHEVVAAIRGPLSQLKLEAATQLCAMSVMTSHMLCLIKSLSDDGTSECAALNVLLSCLTVLYYGMAGTPQGRSQCVHQHDCDAEAGEQGQIVGCCQ